MSEIKIFNKWDIQGIEISDPGLKRYVNLKPVIVPRNFGRHAKHQYHKSQVNIIERFLTHLFIPGHKGKKHFISSGRSAGKTLTAYKILNETFRILEEKTKKNPVEILVKAIENSALREEVTSFQVGGIIVRRAVITSPQRRVDLAIRLIVQSSYQKSVNKPKTFPQALSDELIATYNYDAQNSNAIREKERIERE